MIRNFIIGLVAGCFCLPAFATAPGFTNVIAAKIVDANGNPLASGTATFQVVDASGHPMSVEMTTSGGQVITAPVSVQVNNGMLSAPVIDVSLVAPSFPCVSGTIVDNATGDVVWRKSCLQPVGGTYDIDLYSDNTTPILPQAGDTVQGNLGVNGNLNVTGNLNIGGLTTGNFTATTGTIMSLNGSINAASFPGADIGASANAALASCTDLFPCHVYIPPGVYTYATTISLPRMAQGLEFTCDRNAHLTFSGTGDAIRTAVAVNGGNTGGTVVDGGCKLDGSPAANSGIHLRASQGTQVIGLSVGGFSNGDGLWVDGANTVEVYGGGNYHDNKVNIHLSGNTCNGANVCTWDRDAAGKWVNSGAPSVTGFAPNAVHITDTRIETGGIWGVLIDDVIGGSVSGAYNTTLDHDVLEGNGAGGVGGAVMIGLSTQTNITRSYFEGNDHGIIAGCVSGTPAVVTAPANYTSQFCGTATALNVEGNFFNDPPQADEVFLNFVSGAGIDKNVVNSNSACLVDGGTWGGKMSLIANLTLGSGALSCSGGTAGGAAGSAGGDFSNLVEYADHSNQAMHWVNGIFDNVLNVGQLIHSDTAHNAMVAGGGHIVGVIGAITIWQSLSPPGGSCGTPTTMDIWLTGTDMYICSGTWKLMSHN